MSIRKVVAGLLIAAGIAIMAVPFFWRTTGEKQTEQLISEFEQTLEDDYDEETDVEEEQTSISKEDEAILKEGGVIGIIEIPGLDIRYPVMEGTTSKVRSRRSFIIRRVSQWRMTASFMYRIPETMQ